MSDKEQNLEIDLDPSKAKQLVNNILENVGKIIVLNTRQNGEYAEILYKLNYSINLK